MSKNTFSQVIFNSSNNKTTRLGFSLGKYTNTKPVTGDTIATGCTRGIGSIKRIQTYINRHPVATTTVTNPPVYSISSWNTVNPLNNSLGNWFNVVCNNSGQYVYLTNPNILTPSIWVSDDYGVSFTESLYNGSYHNYSNIAVDSSGDYILCPAIRDLIFNSTDYGVTIGSTSDPGGFWWVPAMNNDGSVACIAKNFNNSGGSTPNPIFISTNQSLFSVSLKGLYCSWSSVAMNSVGNFIVVCSYDGYVYYTTNTGSSWTNFNLPQYCWSSVTVNSTGTNIGVCSLDGYIYVSTNGGGSWSSCAPSNQTWSSIYIANNTNLILACAINDNIYYSSNYGTSWLSTSPNGIPCNWSSICCSDDGNYVYACVNGGNIYTTTTSST